MMGVIEVTNDVYVVLYLLYGFTFILMGVYAVREYQKTSSVLPLVNAIIYLGLFGITHGISEWLTMLRYANVFDSFRVEIFFMSRILKAISFLSLIQFGFTLLFKPFGKKMGRIFLIIYFIVFTSVFYSIIYTRGVNYLYDNPKFLIFTLRYMMALPGSILAMIVLIRQGLKVKKLDRLWMMHYVYLGIVVMIYGILDGLFVRKADFFPANVFYNQWFIETLGIPIQLFKILVGFGFYVGIRLVIKSFTWEKNNKYINLQTEDEFLRKKQQLNQILHDDLIQSLYIDGLKIEVLKDDCKDEEVKKTMTDVVKTLNQNIDLIREFIKNSQIPTVTIEDFGINIGNLIQEVLIEQDRSVQFTNLLHEQGLYVINKELLTHIYYILKELLINIVKHSEADHVKVLIYQEVSYIKLIVEDNGIGFDESKIKPDEHIGLSSIRKRVESLNGSFKINSARKSLFRLPKTCVTIIIPIEVYYV